MKMTAKPPKANPVMAQADDRKKQEIEMKAKRYLNSTTKEFFFCQRIYVLVAMDFVMAL